MNGVLELTDTAWELEPFARNCGYAGLPFRWDEEFCFVLRAELDAAFFHLYSFHPVTPRTSSTPSATSVTGTLLHELGRTNDQV